MKTLTSRQRQVLQVIDSLIDAKGWAPTLREIAAPLGIRSSNAMHGHMVALERAGAIERATGLARGLRITKAGRQLIGGDHATA